jgi:hypothetical protein
MGALLTTFRGATLAEAGEDGAGETVFSDVGLTTGAGAAGGGGAGRAAATSVRVRVTCGARETRGGIGFVTILIDGSLVQPATPATRASPTLSRYFDCRMITLSGAPTFKITYPNFDWRVPEFYRIRIKLS